MIDSLAFPPLRAASSWPSRTAVRHRWGADALRIAAVMLGTQAIRSTGTRSRGHTARLFAESTVEGTTEHEHLRIALINAGAIKAAYRDTPDGS